MESSRALWILVALLAAITPAFAQGKLTYDQQSASSPFPASLSLDIQSNEPIGQSFVPSLGAVGFIQLEVADPIFNGVGATIYVNLLSDSITGTILGSTDPVFVPVGPYGVVGFFYSVPVSVSPGTTYYLQPVVHSGDLSRVNAIGDPYPQGVAYLNGLVLNGEDLWFREGIPEPSVAWLLLAGGSVLACIRYRRIRERRGGHQPTA